MAPKPTRVAWEPGRLLEEDAAKRGSGRMPLTGGAGRRMTAMFLLESVSACTDMRARGKYVTPVTSETLVVTVCALGFVYRTKSTASAASLL